MRKALYDREARNGLILMKIAWNFTEARKARGEQRKILSRGYATVSRQTFNEAFPAIFCVQRDRLPKLAWAQRLLGGAVLARGLGSARKHA